MLRLNECLWIAMGIYWIASSLKVNKTRMKESVISRWLHLGPTGFAFYALFNDVFDHSFFGKQVFPPGLMTGVLGNLITAFSLTFAIWARRHLGRYWSAAITLKEGHKLIRTGPYHYVRHPIYTGLLFGILGTALIEGKLLGLFIVVMIIAVYYRKIRLEEAVLSQAFGPEYQSYRKEVKALIPFVL